MAKPYIIGLEVEEVALGPVMRKLNTIPGVIAIHLDFDKPRGAAKSNGAMNGAEEEPRAKKAKKTKKAKKKKTGEARATRGVFEENGRQALYALIRKNKTMSMEEMRNAFEVTGRSPKSVSFVLHKLIQGGAVYRSAPDTYKAKANVKEV